MRSLRWRRAMTLLPAALVALCIGGSPGPAEATAAVEDWTAARMRGAPVRYTWATRRVCQYGYFGMRQCFLQRVRVPVVARRRGGEPRYRAATQGGYAPAARPAYRPAYAPAYRPQQAYSPPAGPAPSYGAGTGTSQRFYRVGPRPQQAPPRTYGAGTGGSQTMPGLAPRPSGGGPRVFGAQTGGSQNMFRAPRPSGPPRAQPRPGQPFGRP